MIQIRRIKLTSPYTGIWWDDKLWRTKHQVRIRFGIPVIVYGDWFPICQLSNCDWLFEILQVKMYALKRRDRCKATGPYRLFYNYPLIIRSAKWWRQGMDGWTLENVKFWEFYAWNVSHCLVFTTDKEGWLHFGSLFVYQFLYSI